MDPWLVVTFASGGAMALLGLFLFAADPRRDWNRVFALFAIFWGLQIVAANAVRVLDDPVVARPVGVLALALVIPLYFFVVVFSGIYPRPRAPFGASLPALFLLLVPAVVALALLLFAPRLLLADVVALPTGGSTMRWGPLFAPLVLAPLYGGFFYALFVMMRRFEETDRRIERRQILLVLVALGLFVAYNVPLQLLLFGEAALGAAIRLEAASREAALIGAVMLAGLALLVVLAFRLRALARRAASKTATREVRLVALALAGAACVGVAEGAIAVAGGPRFQMVGFVRAATVALVAYGVARYQLFDLDLRVKNATHVLTTLLILGVVGVAVWSASATVGVSPAARGTMVALLLVVGALPLGSLVRRVTDQLVPHVTREGEHLYLRKLEVYQAALAGGTDAAALDRLRLRLGLGEEDHDVARRLVARQQTGVPLAPGVVAFDRYLIEAVAGEGTYGRVFVARDLQVGRRVAIKELEAHWRGQAAVWSRFLREARVMGRLSHPRIVSLYEVERRGADQFLVLEHVEGGSLAERLEGGRLPRDEALRLFRELVEGLAVAHGRGVVHRDLKPANILLDLDGHAKLADFGVAAVFAQAPDATLVGLPEPEAPGLVGNLLYMAPEQAAGAPATPRSDLYSAGAILYHMLTGRPHRALVGLDAATARTVVAEDARPSLDPFTAPERRLLERTLGPLEERAADAAALLRSMPPAAPRDVLPDPLDAADPRPLPDAP